MQRGGGRVMAPGLATAFAVHPLADLIPAMSDGEYAELRADIEANGLLAPIMLYEGKILDGRHRARACGELGLEPETHEYEGEEAARFVISMNVHRRHLTTTQKAMIAKAALPYYEAMARGRMAEGGSKAAPGRPAERVGRAAQALGNRARDQAAGEVGVSGRTVDRLVRVEEEAPDLYERVVAEEISLTEADEEVRSRKEPEPDGKFENWDRSSERFRQVAAKTVERTWTGLHSLAVVCPALAEMDAALLAETVSGEDLAQMVEGAVEATRHLRKFTSNLRKRM